MKNRISLFILTILMLICLFTNVAFAAESTDYVPVIRYRIGESGEDVQASLTEIGTWSPSTAYSNNKVYLVSLPYNAQISDCGVSGTGYDLTNYVLGKNIKNSYDFEDISNYILGDEFYGNGLDSKTTYSKIFIAKLDNKDDVLSNISTSADLKGYCIRIVIKQESKILYLPAVVVQISTTEPTEKVNVYELIELSGQVTGDNADNWYNSNDRWNGKVSSDNGFWADMQAYLENAQNYIATPPESQDSVDVVAEALESAIDNLIPIANINTTALYEGINEQIPKLPSGYNEYTPTSLEAYNSAKEDAQVLLDSLYDSEGNPTEKNKSLDTELEAEIEDKINALKASRESLDPLLLDDETKDAKLKYETLNNLLNVYDKARFDESLYTAESWDNFVFAYDGVKNYVDTHPAPGSVLGKRQYDEANEQYDVLWRGIHGLADKKDEITVTIKVVDTLALRIGIPSNDKCGIHTDVKLSSDKTLNAAIDGLNDEILSALNVAGVGHMDCEHLYATSINGILTTKPYAESRGIAPLHFKTPTHWKYGDEYYDIQLHDGDVVTLAFLERPVTPGSAGTGYDAIEEFLIHNFYKQSAILQDGKNVDDVIEVDEGQELNLSAIYTFPHISTYSDKVYPLSGVTAFVSEAAESVKSIRPSYINTDVIADGSGNFHYTFYSSGYYALSIHDIRANAIVGQGKEVDAKSAYGLTIGDTIYVHVNEITAKQLEAAKKKFAEELDTIYGTYTESFFSSDDWVKINNFHETGISSIENAVELKEAKAAYDNAINGIKKIQDKTVNDNTSKLDGFRAILSRLPNDTSLLGQSNAFLAEELIARYDVMSAYQKNQLIGLEFNKYDSIKSSYDAGLPVLAPYKLSFEIAADSSEAKAAIDDMISYVSEHGDNTDLFYNFKIAERKVDGTAIFNVSHSANISTSSAIVAGFNSDSTTQSAITAYPDNFVRFAPTLDKFVYSFDDDISGNGWTIRNDGPELESNQSGYIAVKGKTILIGGTEYEIKKIEITGVYDIDTEQGKITENNRNIIFPDALRNFIMPYQDAIVTVTWGPADGGTGHDDSPELALAKTNAANTLKAEYVKYKNSEYTDDKWVELVNAKNKGLDEIYKAASIDSVTLAMTNAIAAMESIEKKSITGDIPDFGDILGTVDVYVENTTFPGGAFTGTILSKSNFDYAENDTMMTIVLRALAEKGYGWTGTGGTKTQGIDDYGIDYLASITKNGKSLGEFSGARGSGWMAALNDFFINEGLQQFTVKNGKVSDGDEIRIMFTQNLGEDLGGTWGNSDTTLSNLKLSAGKLYPKFSSSIYNYTLVLKSSDSKLKVTPTASNRNYLVKTFLNDKVTSNTEGNSFYKRTRYIPVGAGSYINIGVGEYAWPSMNNQEAEARNYSGTWYRLNIITPDDGALHVMSLIDGLPSAKIIKLSNEDTIKNIRDVFELLSSSEKLKVTNVQKLIDAENRITFLNQIEDVKALLKKIPAASKVTLSDKSAVMNADAAYKKLTDEQKLYITVGDVKNYNDAIDKLTELGAFKSGGKPSKIQGSLEAPIIKGSTVDIDAETKVVNGIANSNVTTQQIKDILTEIKDSDVSGITINVNSDKEILKSNVEIPKTSIVEISKGKLDLIIQTPIGSIEIPNKALEKISDQAEGSNVEITMDKLDKQKLTQEQKSAVGDYVVYDISIMSKEKLISSFGGQEITISLPYALKEGQIKDKVSIWYLNDKGELEKIQCKYDESTGLATFATNHLSYYIVGYDKSIIFDDVNENDWFYDSVMYAVQKGLFTGTSDTTFSPNSPMTRSMLVTVLHRLGEVPASAAVNPFIDVKDSNWYMQAVKWSLENDLVKGVTSTEFKPQNNVTREQLAVMLYRFAKIKGLNTEIKGNIETFADKQNVSSWAYDAITWAVDNGLISGKVNNILDPSGNATRAEVATILQRFNEKLK